MSEDGKLTLLDDVSNKVLIPKKVSLILSAALKSDASKKATMEVMLNHDALDKSTLTHLWDGIRIKGDLISNSQTMTVKNWTELKNGAYTATPKSDFSGTRVGKGIRLDTVPDGGTSNPVTKGYSDKSEVWNPRKTPFTVACYANIDDFQTRNTNQNVWFERLIFGTWSATASGRAFFFISTPEQVSAIGIAVNNGSGWYYQYFLDSSGNKISNAVIKGKHLTAITRAGTTFNLYVDGVLMGTLELDFDISISSQQFQLIDNVAPGIYHEVRFYSEALSPEDLAALFNYVRDRYS